ncbi:hypothetical protein BC828DRAFT_396555 [Blastocladiella britannica]|nr:hypothetical protein BC828DRAFT_396555 [Blastocladiella britannica]
MGEPMSSGKMASMSSGGGLLSESEKHYIDSFLDWMAGGTDANSSSQLPKPPGTQPSLLQHDPSSLSAPSPSVLGGGKSRNVHNLQLSLPAGPPATGIFPTTATQAHNGQQRQDASTRVDSHHTSPDVPGDTRALVSPLWPSSATALPQTASTIPTPPDTSSLQHDTASVLGTSAPQLFALVPGGMVPVSVSAETLAACLEAQVPAPRAQEDQKDDHASLASPAYVPPQPHPFQYQAPPMAAYYLAPSPAAHQQQFFSSVGPVGFSQGLQSGGQHQQQQPPGAPVVFHLVPAMPTAQGTAPAAYMLATSPQFMYMMPPMGAAPSPTGFTPLPYSPISPTYPSSNVSVVRPRTRTRGPSAGDSNVPGTARKRKQSELAAYVGAVDDGDLEGDFCDASDDEEGGGPYGRPSARARLSASTTPPSAAVAQGAAAASSAPPPPPVLGDAAAAPVRKRAPRPRRSSTATTANGESAGPATAAATRSRAPSTAGAAGSGGTSTSAEKKRRTMIRNGYAALVDLVPPLREAARTLAKPSVAQHEDGGGADDENDDDTLGAAAAHTVSKAAILGKTAEFLALLQRKVFKYQAIVDQAAGSSNPSTTASASAFALHVPYANGT